jgi:hypothetical protein
LLPAFLYRPSIARIEMSTVSLFLARKMPIAPFKMRVDAGAIAQVTTNVSAVSLVSVPSLWGCGELWLSGCGIAEERSGRYGWVVHRGGVGLIGVAASGGLRELAGHY